MKKITKIVCLALLLILITAAAGCGSGPSIGENGNWYIGGDDTGISAQGPKGDEGEKGGDGDDGKSGATWSAGAIPPDNTDGSNGDLYLDTLTGEIYIKKDWEWISIGNIKGDKCDTGEHGDKGNAGEDGDNGLSAYEIYKKYNPDYTADEDEWIYDMTSGRLVTYKISFDSRGGSKMKTIVNIKYGTAVSEPEEEPGRLGYIFDGWYKDSDAVSEPWDWANDNVIDNLILYAKWIVDESLVQIETRDMIEFPLDYWGGMSSLPGYPIKLKYSGETIVYECSVDKGGFRTKEYLPVIDQPIVKKLIIKPDDENSWLYSNNTIFWHPILVPYSPDVYSTKQAFIDIILIIDGYITGYSVVDIYQYDGPGIAFESRTLISIIFPEVNGERQNITEKQIEAALEEVKNV